jgi:hypothetical protein
MDIDKEIEHEKKVEKEHVYRMIHSIVERTVQKMIRDIKNEECQVGSQ